MKREGILSWERKEIKRGFSIRLQFLLYIQFTLEGPLYLYQLKSFVVLTICKGILRFKIPLDY